LFREGEPSFPSSGKDKKAEGKNCIPKEKEKSSQKKRRLEEKGNIFFRKGRCKKPPQNQTAWSASIVLARHPERTLPFCKEKKRMREKKRASCPPRWGGAALQWNTFILGGGKGLLPRVRKGVNASLRSG